ncbi:ABC transporter permease [Leptospira perolatii]|uniref:ABC transporter permease n=1 Tax=Leptospira perolatii TaxID=2023191 RepID=A0A2M9ZQ17_9LEPT|nr:FtsX-like permease family protein [Leptospira perolatii]PJZ68242.1 ABC transporter permease [Leptospira perolatii]PJZ74167.1 ABC transporter permease [Leptospira perolatii]
MNFQLNFLFLFEYFRTHIPRIVFALVGISLGVGLFLSTSTNASRAEKSLIDFSMGYFKGNSKIKVGPSQPGQPIPWKVMEKIFYAKELRHITGILPRIQRDGITSDNLRVVYIGLDLSKEFNKLKSDSELTDSKISNTEPKPIDSHTFVSKALEQKFLGAPFTILLGGKSTEFKNTTPLDLEGGYIIIEDLSKTSERLNIEQGVDYLLLDCPEEKVQFTKRKLLEILGATGENFAIETSEEIKEKSANALRSFQLNLLIISFISLLIAFFMVSNTMSGLYLSREKELGILRTLGLGSNEATFLFLGQSLLLGAVGSLFGLVIGTFFSGLDLFRPESPLVDKSFLSTYASISTSQYLLAWSLGMLGSAFSSLIPSIRAGKIPPLSILRDATTGKRNFSTKRTLVIGLILFFVSLGISNIPIPSKIPFAGLIGLAGIVIGITLTFPYSIEKFSDFVLRLFQKSDRSFLFVKVGLEELKNNPTGNTLTAATIMLSVSLVVCLTILTDSYKYSLIHWVENEFQADLTVINDRYYQSGIHGGVPTTLKERISRLELSDRLDGFLVNKKFETDRGVFLIAAYDFSAYKSKPDSLERLVHSEKDILISSNMAFMFKLKVGDTLTSRTKTGFQVFTIRGIKEHFFSEQGTVMMDINFYPRIFPVRDLNSVKLFLKPEFRSLEGKTIAIRRLKDLLDSDPELKDISILDHDQLKNLYVTELNKVFRILDSVKVTALFITFISLLSSLMHNLYDKQRVLGVLKYFGASQEQLGTIVKSESIFLTSFGAWFGIFTSLVVSPIILYVVNKNAFGWTLHFTFFPWMPGFILTFAPILGWLSSFYPLRILRNLKFKLSSE